MDPADTNPPFFTALEPRAWSTNRLYRVYVRPGELVCVWAGSGQEVARALAAQGGLVGGLLSAAASPARKNTARQQELDAKPLAEAREDHKHNFALPLADVEAADVEFASFWFRMTYPGVTGSGLLRLRTSSRGTVTLALATADDLRRVLQLLPPLLGDKLLVGLTWDEGRGRWVACPPSRRFSLPPAAETTAPPRSAPPASSRTAAPPAPPAAPPRTGREILVVALLVLLLLGGGAAVVALVLGLGALPGAGQPNQNSAARPPAEKGDHGPPPPKMLIQFTYPESGFSAAFPKAPEHISRRSSNTSRTMHVYQVQDPEDTYTVVTFEPPLPGRPPHLFQVLKTVREDFPLGQIEPEKPLELGTYHGWEFTIRFADRTVVQRVFHGHGRDYTLRVSSSRYPDIADTAQQFLESFRPADANEPPPLAPPPPAASGPPPRRLQGSSGDLMALRFTGDGKAVTAASQNGELLTWDAASSNRTGAVTFPEEPVRFLAFALSPDGTAAAASALDGRFYLLDPETARPRAALVDRLTPDIVWSVAFSPDGRVVAAGHGNNLIRLWDAARQQPGREMKSDRRVQALAFTPDGKTLAAGGPGNTVTLWDADAATARATLQGSRSEVASSGALWALACSRDGKMLAAGGNDQTVRLWNLDTRTEVAALKHAQAVRSLAFSPDGKLLAAGDDAGNVSLWDVGSGSRRALLPAGQEGCSVRAVTFSPGGVELAAACGNEVLLWDLAGMRPGGAANGKEGD
jgi:WD40 repeat protein